MGEAAPEGCAVASQVKYGLKGGKADIHSPHSSSGVSLGPKTPGTPTKGEYAPRAAEEGEVEMRKVFVNRNTRGARGSADIDEEERMMRAHVMSPRSMGHYFSNPVHVSKRAVALRFVENMRSRGEVAVDNTSTSDVDVDMTGNSSDAYERMACRVTAYLESMPRQYVCDIDVSRRDPLLQHMRLMERAALDADATYRIAVERASAYDIDSSGYVITNGAHDVATASPMPTAKLSRASLSFNSSPNLVLLAQSLSNGVNGSTEDDDSFTSSLSSSSPPSQQQLLQQQLQQSQEVIADNEGPAHGEHMNTRDEQQCSSYDVTLATKGRTPKLLSSLLSFFSDLGLNIIEVHTFSSASGVALDLFTLGGDFAGTTDDLKARLARVVRQHDAGKEEKEEEEDMTKSASGALSLRTVTDVKEKLEDDDSTHQAMETAKAATVVDFFSGSSFGPLAIDMDDLVFGARFSSGAFGDISRGKYRGQTVAIKTMRSSPGTLMKNNDFAKKEFKQEILMLSMINHPKIVRFIGAAATDVDLIIVTELMEGGNLREYVAGCNGGKGLSLRTILSFSENIADALIHLHSKHIVHRDIKSSNLLLDGSYSVLKVGDFGVARVIEEGQNQDMTHETGTYRWMAPEVIRHDNTYGTPADIYSTAMCMTEMVTGMVPFRDLAPVQAAFAVCESGLRPDLSSRRVDSALEALITRCWAADPTQRPSAVELHGRLCEMRQANSGGGSRSRKNNLSSSTGGDGSTKPLQSRIWNLFFPTAGSKR